MNAEKYLKQFTEGTLVERLQKMADEYLGPSAASCLTDSVNQAKRKNLLEAIKLLGVEQSRQELKEMSPEVRKMAEGFGKGILY